MARLNSSERETMSMAVLEDDGRGTESRGSLYSASVQISSLVELTSNNPRPWQAGQQSTPTTAQTLQQDYLSPIKLVQLTAEPDLSRVTCLHLSIDTTENSVGNFGAHLPNLTQLRFTESNIPCVRDLGTSLSAVRILWMPRCKLKDLDGLPALQNLHEFYLPFNEVEDVSAITMLSCLDVLDLESNNLSDADQLGYLALCPSLVSLTLEGNPLSMMLAETRGGEFGYRTAIQEAVSSIRVLDDVALCPTVQTVKERAKNGGENGVRESGITSSGEGEEFVSRSSVFMLSEAGMEKDWRIIQQSIKLGVQVEQDLDASSPMGRPVTAPPRRSLSLSPTPPTTADESSNLTHGLSQVICGNPVRALRARKQHGLSSQSYVESPTSFREPDMVLQQLQLDTDSRTKSEENVCSETQQPDHFPPSQINTVPFPTTPQQPNFKRLPTPPSTTSPTAPERPKSVADFRHRRYRKSIDTPRH